MSQGKVDNMNFSVTEKDGQEIFVCNICQKEAKTAKAVKAHITSKHRERPVDSDDEEDANKKRSKEDDDKDDEVQEEELNEWLRKASEAGASGTSSPPEEFVPPTSHHEIERMVIDSSTGMEGTLEQAVERIRFLESEAKSQEDQIKEMAAQIQTKTDLVHIANSKAEEIASKLEEKESMLKKFNATFAFMKTEIVKLKEENGGGTNQEIAKKLKKATDELKIKSKMLDEAERAKEELNIKVGTEMSIRAKSEADNVMLQNCIKALQSVVDNKETNQKKVKERCSFLDKPGGCKKGLKCNFQHPEGEPMKAGRQDCVFWLTGRCKYPDTECRGEHDPAKKGSNGKKKDNMMGFAESLVQVLDQANQMEATWNPAQGLEGQSNIMALLQGILQPTNQQVPPPPFTNSSTNFVTTGRSLAGQQVPTFQQAGSSNDPAQLLLQALQLAQAARR